jgi:hypothetical protein
VPLEWLVRLYDQYTDTEMAGVMYVQPNKNCHKYLFHGTTEASLLNICRDGFDPEHASFRLGGSTAPKMFGLGLYLASNATKSAQMRYTKGSNRLLVCECVLVSRCIAYFYCIALLSACHRPPCTVHAFLLASLRYAFNAMFCCAYFLYSCV